MKIIDKRKNLILNDYELKKLYELNLKDYNNCSYDEFIKELLMDSNYELYKKEDLRLRNRRRCLTCEFYGKNICPLMVGADVFQIDNCILNKKEIKELPKDSLDEFIFYKNPLEYLSYLMYKRKDILPEVGQVVITLSAGFSSYYSGKFLKVTSLRKLNSDLYEINLVDCNDETKEFSVYSDEWYKRLFIL